MKYTLLIMGILLILLSCKEEDTEKRQNASFFFTGETHSIKLDTANVLTLEIGRALSKTANSTQIYTEESSTLPKSDYHFNEKYNFEVNENTKKVKIEFDKKSIIKEGTLNLRIQTKDIMNNPYSQMSNTMSIKVIPAIAN